MNRMFLKSTIQLSQTVVKAVKNGLSKDNLFMLSHQTMRRKHGTSMGAEAESALIGAAKKARLTDNEVVSIIMTEGISLGQINYAIKKDKEQAAAKTSLKKAKKQKKIKLSVKVPVTKVSDIQTAVNQLAAKVSRQKVIKFSAPLKVVTSTVSSFC